MNPAIYLSCLVVVIGSLVWTASARPSFEADRTRVIEAYKDGSPDSISDSDVHFLVNFLDKYRDQVELTPEERRRADDAVRQYKEERDRQPLVDGVPPQGGWFSKLARAIVVQLGIELASEGIKKATSKD